MKTGMKIQGNGNTVPSPPKIDRLLPCISSSCLICQFNLKRNQCASQNNFCVRENSPAKSICKYCSKCCGTYRRCNVFQIMPASINLIADWTILALTIVIRLRRNIKSRTKHNHNKHPSKENRRNLFLIHSAHRLSIFCNRHKYRIKRFRMYLFEIP